MANTNYKHPNHLHELAMTLSHEAMNDKLGTLGYVKQQKGGFWVEHRSYLKNEHGKTSHRRTKQKSKYTNRWDRKNRLAVKTDYLKRVQALKINTAVCLPSVSPVLVANTFRAHGVKNLHGFEIGNAEYKACMKALKGSKNPHAILMHKGDVMNHLGMFNGDCFVEADFCGVISSYKKFFQHLPKYWSLTVSSARYGNVDKILGMFGKFMGGKVNVGKTAIVENKGASFEITKLSIGSKKFNLYKYRDPNPKTNKCSTMLVITNV